MFQDEFFSCFHLIFFFFFCLLTDPHTFQVSLKILHIFPHGHLIYRLRKKILIKKKKINQIKSRMTVREVSLVTSESPSCRTFWRGVIVRGAAIAEAVAGCLPGDRLPWQRRRCSSVTKDRRSPELWSGGAAGREADAGALCQGSSSVPRNCLPGKVGVTVTALEKQAEKVKDREKFYI